jgi:hypothetical protein
MVWLTAALGLAFALSFERSCAAAGNVSKSASEHAAIIVSTLFISIAVDLVRIG